MGNLVVERGTVELEWEMDEFGIVRYALTTRGRDGQYVFLDAMEQGPFDTALEVAQWAWRAISKRVPPSRC